MGRKIGSFLSFIAIIVEIISALILTPTLIRSFGQAEYGVYSLTISITGYLVLLDFGVGNSVIRYMSKFRVNNDIPKQRNFLGIITIFYSIIAVIVVAVGIIIIMIFPKAFAKGLSIEEINLAQQLLRLTIINMAVTLGTAGFYYTIISFENFIVSKGIPIFLGIVKVFLSLIALHLGFRSLTIVFINLTCTIVTRLMMVVYLFAKMKLLPILKGLDFSQLKEIITYSSIIMIQMIATQVNNLTDHILLGALVADSATILAVYGVGSQIVTYFRSIGSSVNSVIMPGVVGVVEKDNSPEKIQNEIIRIGRLNLIFLGIIWCTFLIYGKRFIILWSGTENFFAYYVAVMIMLPEVFLLTQTVGNQFLWALNKHKAQSIIKLLIVMLNIVFTIFLIKWRPLLGATIGTMISLIVGDIFLMQFVFKKNLGVKLCQYYKGLIKGIAPSLIIATILGWVTSFIAMPGWVGFIVGCFVMFMGYLMCLLLFGFSNYERFLIKNIAKKLLKRT